MGDTVRKSRRSRCGAASAGGNASAWTGPILITGLGVLLLSVPSGDAGAFPLIDPSNQDLVPQGTELAPADAQGLRHQLQLADGLAPPAGGGWTFIPRLDVEEMFTDNALQARSPRQSDLITYIAPGIAVAGDLPRLQLTFDYSPALSVYTRTSSLTSLTHQLNAIGLATVVPDLFFVDVRAISGVHNIYGGAGGLGSLGTSSLSAASASPNVLGFGANGLSRNDEVQTSNVTVSPYLLQDFGDWGTGKLGYSLSAAQSDQLTGFASSPFPAGGTNGQSLLSQEEIAHYASGNGLGRIQDIFDIDLTQSRIRSFGLSSVGTAGSETQSSYSSSRAFITDRVLYQVYRGVQVFVSGGHEDIRYTLRGQQPINDLTWSFGTTLTPDPDTSVTVSYGHNYGFNAVSANGTYAVTSRTRVNFSYSSTVGTQLENLQSQINLATAGTNGTLVNGANGGQLFGLSNGLALADGVYRFDTLAMGGTTTLDRDSFSVNVLLSRQGRAGNSANTLTTTLQTFTGQWLHQLRPDLTFNALMSYSIQGGVSGAVAQGNTTSIAGSATLQYQISDTLTGTLRYSLLTRDVPAGPGGFYANMLLIGLSKSF